MRRALLLLVLLFPSMAACRTWEAVSDLADIPGSAPAIRIETTGGDRVTLEDVTLRNDTLYSEARRCAWTVAYGRTPGRTWCGGVAIARADVVRAEVPRGTSPAWKGSLMVLGGLGAAAVVIALLELLWDGTSSTLRRRRQLVRGERPSRP